MKRTLLAAAACAALTLAIPGSVTAQPTSICPDDMLLVPAALVPKGDVQDKNENGLVCVKLTPDGEFHGGPDDRADDIVL